MAEKGTEYEVNQDICEEEPILKTGVGVRDNSLREIDVNIKNEDFGINDGILTEDSNQLSLEERSIRNSVDSIDTGEI